MYSSGYSQVTKNSPMAQKRMQYRSKGKSCGYYMRIVFFFSSLIQSLIIVSLVLFLVYGKTQDSASTARILDLEESFSRLSIENVALKQQRKNLTNLLNVTLTQKARNDWELKRFRHFINISSIVIQDYDKKLQQCTTNLFMCNASPRFPCDRPPVPDNCNCGLLVERLKARLELVSSNFTQTVQKVRIEMEQAAKERDYINLEAIHLRRDKSILERELKFQKEKYKDEFFRSLSGVSNVSKAFLEKIDSLFPTHLAFQLTCTKQREHLEQIRTNCTTLSREVENKLQNYLDVVGGQVSDIQAENSRLKAENWRLSEDYHWCNKNRTGQDREHKEKLGKLQQKHDQDKERLLMDKMKLNGEIQVLENSVKYKNKEVDHLTQQINYLNMSCKAGLNSRTVQSGWGLAGGGQLGRTGSGGLGSSLASTGLNKFGSTGLGSSSSSFSSPGSSSSLGSTGLGLNKFGSTGLGSSSSSFSSPGSNSNLGSTGLGLNKFGSTGLGSSSSSNSSPGSSSSLGSTGLGLNKFGSTGLGSSSSSNSSPGSSSSLGSTGLGLNKFGSTGLGSSSSSNSSPGSSSSLGSTGLGLNKVGSTGSGLNKQGSTGGALSSLGSASSNPGLSSSGLGLNKPTLNGRGSSTTGSSSSGSTGTKTGSTSSGFSWLGFGSSNSGQSKTGSGTASGTGRGTSSGSSNSGTGSAGSGRIGGLGGGSVNVAQHLQMLQLLINPPEPEEKEDRFRLYG